MTTATVIGSTGLVGSHILSQLLGHDAFKTVQTISRRQPNGESAKLNATIEGDTAKWCPTLASLQPKPDVVLSALGTTRAAAGGIANQWKIDHDLNVELAKTAKENGVKTFVFISSGGTRGLLSGHVPYSQMKIGVEDSIKSLDFDHAIILRPGILLGQRETPKAQWIQSLAYGLGHIAQTFQDHIGQEAEDIARAAIKATLLAQEGKAPSKYWVLEQADIIRMGREEEKKKDAEAKTSA